MPECVGIGLVVTTVRGLHKPRLDSHRTSNYDVTIPDVGCLEFQMEMTLSLGGAFRDFPGDIFGKSESAARTSPLRASFREISCGIASKDGLY